LSIGEHHKNFKREEHHNTAVEEQIIQLRNKNEGTQKLIDELKREQKAQTDQKTALIEEQ
jgi:hypothetical protein